MVAGCICLNVPQDKVIMISSSVHPNKWVLPKGGIELDEGDDFVVSAVRETWEEAGCEGKIVQKLPIVYDSRGSKAPILPPGKEFDPQKTVPKSEFHFYEMEANRIELVEALNSSGIHKDEVLDTATDAY
ncbi:nudix superfamily hydrolase 8-oxo-dGTP pyrophosphatase [Yamadazyma tenuis]|uniref:nudix superfamily hydrolase 8-oxo-dGTP pyrophosphatase n=1 Tax=Candida tenuis TaxID=2315449 RepID=UPI0027AA0EB4|nr:nudix superfamily hydrolase 8-oxo-dGTP pyrophosphatase [Yamadazyma tenuis]